MENEKDTLNDRFNVLEELMLKTETSLNRILKKQKQSPQKTPIINTRKNHPLHLLVEKDLIESLRTEAKENKISVGELCRKKLRGDSQLDRIEMKIDRLKQQRI